MVVGEAGKVMGVVTAAGGSGVLLLIWCWRWCY